MPKIIGTSLAEHRSRTRERLFQALSELMSERTFDSLTMAEIAQRADVGRTAVYNHFQDKEALLLAFISHETAEYSEQLQHYLQGITDPVEQLQVYIQRQLELGTTYHLAPGTDLRQAVSSSTSKELHSHASLVEQILHFILDAAMEQGRIPHQNRAVLVSLIHSCLAGRSLPQDERTRSYLIFVTQLFILRAIGVGEADLRELPVPLELLNQNSRFQDVSVSAMGLSACPVHHSA